MTRSKKTVTPEQMLLLPRGKQVLPSLRKKRIEYVVFDSNRRVAGIIMAFSAIQAVSSLRITRGIAVGDQSYAKPTKEFPDTADIKIGTSEDDIWYHATEAYLAFNLDPRPI